MANVLVRDKARLLRSDGASLDEIVLQLQVPKSTVRYWCRDIVLSQSQQRRIFEKQKMSGKEAAERVRQKRIVLIERLRKEGAKQIGRLSAKELLLAGTALYWAEGYRKGDGEFGFTNSDPTMIRFIIRWLKECCKVEADRIHARICINAIHKNRMKEVKEFWIEATGLPEDQFSKPTFINVVSKKRYWNSNQYFGTLRVKVRRSTDLRRMVMGWIEGLAR